MGGVHSPVLKAGDLVFCLCVCVCVCVCVIIYLPRRRYKTNDAYFSASMPPKSKRKIQLEQARAAKQAKTTGAGPPMPELSSEPATLPQQPGTSYACVSESADTEFHAEDPLNEGVHDDLLSLSVVLWHLLVGILPFKLTSAAELIGRVVGRSDRTIREWRATFNTNKGTFPDTLQGKYQRSEMVFCGKMKT